MSADSESILGNTSLQDLYARASRDLLAMAGQTTALPASTCAIAAPAPAISLVANAEGRFLFHKMPPSRVKLTHVFSVAHG